MGTIPLDYSFERDGVSLADWLWRLVATDPTTRQSAGNAIQSMEYGLPFYPIDWSSLVASPEIAKQQHRFQDAIQATLTQPSFNGAEFVRKLIHYRLALANDARQRVQQHKEIAAKRDARYARITERLRDALGKTSDRAVSKRLRKHLRQLDRVYIQGSMRPLSHMLADPESLAGAVAQRVFSHLGTALLTAPEAVERMLQDPQERGCALTALARLGPAAQAFVPELLMGLDEVACRDADQPGHYFDGAATLGSIGRGDFELVESLVRRLESNSQEVRFAAIKALEQMGTDVCGQEETIARKLAVLLDREEEDSFPVHALASVGRHLPWVRRRVLEFAGPHPAEWKQYPGFPDYSYDAAMGRRGAALDALRYLTDYPDECMPVLIEAMTTFEEYDPDEAVHGPIARIAWIISQFGAKGAAAAIPLASHLRYEDGYPPNEIVKALAAMGPAAQAVLPELYAFRKEGVDEAMLPDLDTSEADEYCDLIGWAIQRIQGR